MPYLLGVIILTTGSKSWELILQVVFLEIWGERLLATMHELAQSRDGWVLRLGVSQQKKQCHDASTAPSGRI